MKAPTQGVLLKLLTQANQTVVPGQLVAVIDEAAAASNGSKSAAPAAKAASSAPTPDAAAPAPEAPGRIPSIRFPPRVTPDGQTISALPAAQAAEVLAKLSGSPAAATGHAAAPAPPAPASAQGAAPERSAAAAQVPSSSVAEAPPRLPLSKMEMELVDLGGAEPYETKPKKKQ